MRITSYLLAVLFSFFSYSQEHFKLRDSIIKHKYSNPNLAIDFGLKYLDAVQSKTPDSLVVGTYAMLGEILFDMGLYSSALDYFNRALDLYEATPDKNKRDPLISQPPWILLNIGSIYFQNGDIEKAEEKFYQSKEIFEKFSNKSKANYGINTSDSNLGLIDEAKKDYLSAEKKYLKIYSRRLKENKQEDLMYSISQLIAINLLKGDVKSADNKFNELNQYYMKYNDDYSSKSLFTRNYGYGYFVYAAYYQSIKKYKKAITFLTKSEDILKNFPTEAASLGSRFAECHLGAGDLEKAEQRAKKNLEIKNLNDTEKIFNYNVLEKIYLQKGLNSELLKVKDSLILISAGGNNARIFKSLNDLETQIQLSRSVRELNQNKIKYNTYLYILIICSIILFFSLITIRVNYNYQKEKGSRLELEKLAIKNELDKRNRELVSKSNFIIQRNDYLKKLKKKIEDPKKMDESISRLSRELNMVISSEKSYQDFDNMFVEVYPDFYKSINQVSKLSKTDLRLASYIKMNHSNDEIAKISGVSIRTIESQRYRLSKKLNLQSGQDLNSFIYNI